MQAQLVALERAARSLLFSISRSTASVFMSLE
jgi:hypothetical protein